VSAIDLIGVFRVVAYSRTVHCRISSATEISRDELFLLLGTGVFVRDIRGREMADP